MRSLLVVPALLVSAVGSVQGQSVQGVWKPVEMVISGGPNPGRHANDVQPGLLIISSRHYSMTFVPGFVARPVLDDTAPDSSWRNVWDQFTANAGTYSIRDSIFTFTPIVAKNPSVMSGKPIRTGFRAAGDSIWFTLSNDGVETRAKWIRIERMQGR